ncbi:hypothetical protein QBC46DRAFT_264241, partial [Diplogelasinospora grovesii]
ELEKTLGARIVDVDYSNVDSLVAQLQDNNVHTLVSTLGGRSPPEQEHALIQAADRSSVTQHYIPSVWGVKSRPEVSWSPVAAPKLAIFEALEKTQLEWTLVANGFFLDYWGMPKSKSYLSQAILALDVAANKAAIPGTGDTPITFTYSGDVTKFTAKLLTLDKWEPESYIISDRLTWNEIVKLKFDVTYDPTDLLRSGKITKLPSHVYVYKFLPKEALQGMPTQFGLLLAEGVLDFHPEQSLNDLFQLAFMQDETVVPFDLENLFGRLGLDLGDRSGERAEWL